VLAVGGSALFTVFDVGRRRVASDQAIAAYDQTVANYRQTVLTGFQQVEDNLAALRISSMRLRFTTKQSSRLKSTLNSPSNARRAA
jgi:outer membrane protein TolC